MTSLSKMCMLTALVAAMLPSVAMGNDAHSSEILSLYGADSTKNNEMSVRYAGDYVTDSYYNRAIANYSLQQMNQALPQIVDPWAVQVIHEMSADMNAHAKRQDLLSVVIIKDNNINAFAVPGGLIGINAGVISAAESMDEVASVLAHEIAHLSLRHYERSSEDKGKLMAMQIGGLLAAIAASSAGGDAAAAMMIGSQTLSMESQAKNSRAHEREADRVGMQILSAAAMMRAPCQDFLILCNKKSRSISTNQAICQVLLSRTHLPLSDCRRRAVVQVTILYQLATVKCVKKHCLICCCGACAI